MLHASGRTLIPLRSIAVALYRLGYSMSFWRLCMFGWNSPKRVKSPKWKDICQLYHAAEKSTLPKSLKGTFAGSTGALRTHSGVSIIDNNASIRKAISRLIESADLVVEKFASAEEFLLSGRSQASACLILDLQLSGTRLVLRSW